MLSDVREVALALLLQPVNARGHGWRYGNWCRVKYATAMNEALEWWMLSKVRLLGCGEKGEMMFTFFGGRDVYIACSLAALRSWPISVVVESAHRAS